jgi:taurine dioxygenase
VVRTHPVTGSRRCSSTKVHHAHCGRDGKRERALLSFLFTHITKPEFQVRWRWQENDLAIWDNRVTQHYANAGLPLPQRRIMQRATILGDVVLPS